MKIIMGHQQGYRDLPDQFADKYESVWVTLPNAELCDPEMVQKYLHWNIDELLYADELGFDGLQINEHHQNGYGFPVSPNMTAAILARTLHERGSDTAIVNLGNTTPTYPVLRVAEEYAMLDVLSGGRLVAGLPVGTAMDTSLCYGIPPTLVRRRWREAHDFIIRAWTEPGPFPFNGEFTQLRYVNPWPQPMQKPHPPIWLCGSGSPGTIQFACDRNYTYNLLSFNGFKAAQGQMEKYFDTLASNGLDDNPYRAGFVQLICVADTDAEAEKLYYPHIKNFFEKAEHVPPYQTVLPGNLPKKALEYFYDNRHIHHHKASYGHYTWKDVIEQARVIAGSPETVAQQLEEAVRTLRIGHLICLMQIQSMDNELTRHSMKLFGEKVMPKVQHIWDDEGHQDHWWPERGRARGREMAAASAEVSA
jgi:alkanesulfonate monooxygenase SsuD/methylene tetrahydromethanopterin reductase-like flavin-dependent oxidoreductase (luciferase family)